MTCSTTAPTPRSLWTTHRSAPPSGGRSVTGTPSSDRRRRRRAGRADRRQQGARHAGHAATTSTARWARAHNDANVLAWGARVVGLGLAEDILDTFLTTDFEGGRHATASPSSPTSKPSSDPPRLAMPFPNTEPDTEIEALLAPGVRAPDHRAAAHRQRELHLAAVLRAVGSVLTNKYSEGYPGSGTTAATQSSTRSRRWPSSGPRRCSAPSTPTSSRTRGPTPTWPPTRRCSSRATRCSGSASTTAGTSPTGRRSTPAACSTASSRTRSRRATSASTSTRSATWPSSTGRR